MKFNIVYNDSGIPTTLHIGKSITYHLRQVTPTELYNIRLAGKQGIVYKYDSNLFYTELTKNITISINGKPHLCGLDCTRVCKDCPRTKDLTVDYQLKFCKNLTRAIYNSWRIEKYDFITEGIEIFNMKDFLDSQYVCACTKYEKSTRIPQKGLKGNHEKKLALVCLLFEDFDGKSMSDFRIWRRTTR